MELEKNFNELKKLNEDIEKEKKELDDLNNIISDLEQKYPKMDVDELIASKRNTAEYINKREELIEKKNERVEKNANYIFLIQKKEDLEFIRKKLIEQQKQKAKDGIKASQDRKEEKRKKQEELDSKKQEFFNKYNKIMGKEGILKGKDATELACIASSLEEQNFLTDEEKKDIKNQISDRLTENNKLIDQPKIKIKEPKVKTTKKLEIINKGTNIIAKGKEKTISFIKKAFDNSIGRLVNGAKGIYQSFCNSRKKKIQEQLDLAFETIDKLMDEIEQMKVEHTNENEVLNKKIEELENKFEEQKNINEDIIKLYKDKENLLKVKKDENDKLQEPIVTKGM